MITEAMPLGAMIFLIVMLLIFAALDIVMLVTLLRPGDERGQIVVWKASAWTLLAMVGTLILDVIENFVRGQYMSVNPFVQPEGQRQCGVILVVLNGVHCLTGHAAALGQLLLGDPQLLAPLSDAVFHISHRASSE